MLAQFGSARRFIRSFTNWPPHSPRWLSRCPPTPLAPSQILIRAFPRRPVSASQFVHPEPPISVSKQRTERRHALVFGLLCVPAQEQGGWFAGSTQQNRCQVLPSSLLSRWQDSDKPAIPPWFTSVNRTRPRRRPRPRKSFLRGDGTNRTYGTHGTYGSFQ